MKHKDEIIRWANSPKGTKVWYRHKDSSDWFLTTSPSNWKSENLIFIVDDDYAEVRKAEKDGKKIEFRNDHGRWEIRTKPSFSGHASCYRIAKDEPEYYYKWKRNIEKGKIDVTCEYFSEECAKREKFEEIGYVKIESTKTTWDDLK